LTQSEAFGKLALYTPSPVSFVCVCVFCNKSLIMVHDIWLQSQLFCVVVFFLVSSSFADDSVLGGRGLQLSRGMVCVSFASLSTSALGCLL
jgi:hypothetical protein